MKRITLLLATALVLSSCCSEPELVTPSAKQVEWADAERHKHRT